MTEIKFEKAKWQLDSDGTWLSILADNPAQAMQCVQGLKDRPYVASIKEWRNRRSLDANALCWALCSEIADVMRLSKEDVYLDMLKHYGQSEIVSVRSDINVSGYFKYVEEAGAGEVSGKTFTHYKVYKGSSEYDTTEMSILLDGIVREAENLNIPVMTDGELDLIKRDWRG